MNDINFVILNLDTIDEAFFGDLSKKIKLGYNTSKDFLTDNVDDLKDKFKTIHVKLSQLVSKNTSSLTKIEHKLQSSGVDVLKLKSLATEQSKKQLFKIKKDEFNVITFVKLVGNGFNDIFNLCLPNKNSIARQATISIVLLAFALYVNTAIDIAGTMLFGPMGGHLFSACFGAPFTEELGKIISINQGAGGAYFIMFNIAEWTLYVKSAMAILSGLPAFAMIATIRILCAYLHYLWSRIHATSSKTAESREVGLKTSMLYHSLYNFIASTPIGLLYIPISIYLAKSKIANLDNKDSRIKSTKSFGVLRSPINSLIKKISS